MSNILHSSKKTTWMTPSVYIEAARDVLGGIDLDPASSPLANEHILAKRFYSLETGEDGLELPWSGTVWLNPPYGKLESHKHRSGQDVWSTLMLSYHATGDVPAGIMLLNAVPDRAWFKPLWRYPMVFTDHRIRFIDPDRGEPGPQPTHGHVFVYLGPDTETFVDRFKRFGRPVLPSFSLNGDGLPLIGLARLAGQLINQIVDVVEGQDARRARDGCD